MARPTMRAVELGATPQMRLPSSKMKTERRKVYFKSQNLKALPQVDWKAAMVRKKAEPIHETKSCDLNACEMSVSVRKASVRWRETYIGDFGNGCSDDSHVQ